MSVRLSRRQFFQATCLSAILTALRANPLGFAQPIVTSESRAIFDEGLHWASKRGAETVCRRIKEAGFNVFMPCVWHGRGTTWPSQLAPWDSKFPALPDYDPLEYLIATAQRFDIEIHPWFTVMRRDRDFFREYYDEGTPKECFDVHRPAFREFISKVIIEVLDRYQIQGINLDYIRAGGVCESPRCVEDYRSTTGRNLLLDTRMRMIPGSVIQELFDWQEAAVGDIVRRVSSAVRRKDQNIILSVDAVPGHRVDQVQGRNSMKWADENLIDVVYMMHYEPSPDWDSLQSFQVAMKRPEALVVLCGNFDRPDGTNKNATSRSGADVANLLQRARSYQGGNGVALYLYGRLTDGQIQELRRSTFRNPARPFWKRGPSSAIAPPENVRVF